MSDSDHDIFTDEELAELEAALGDGFETYTSSAGKELFVDLDDLLPNPFGVSRMRMTAGTDRKIRYGILDFETSMEEAFFELLEDDEVDEAPKWSESQPHRFYRKGLKEYFKRKFETHRSNIKSYDGNSVYGDEDDDWQVVKVLYDRAQIYSRTWYELKIYEHFLELEAFKEPRYIEWMLRLAGELGRMVEHYRWRFTYGASTLRGMASEASLKTANRARSERVPKKMNEKRRAIAELWVELCKSDSTLSRYDTKAADKILKFAIENPRDRRVVKLVIRKSNSIIGVDAIRGHIRKLKTDGKI